MPILFLLYSNSREAPLPTLQAEDEQVYSILSRRSGQGHFAIHRDSYASVDSIIEYLELYREELFCFAFSGHAGRDQLLLNDASAQSAGIAGLLSRCPRLRLVLLNGCSTAGQVSRLLELPSQPVVIATKAPVGDEAAARFAISFFRVLGEQHGTVGEAFEAGLHAARTVSKTPIPETRMLSLRRNAAPAAEEGWGIYAADSKQLDCRLPEAMEAEAQRQQTLVWLKQWGLYLGLGVGLLLVTLFLQLPANSLWLAVVPLFFFFAPVPATLRTHLPRRRLYLLLGGHALLYFPLLFLWMSEDPGWFALALVLGLSAYFFILPLVNNTHRPRTQ